MTSILSVIRVSFNLMQSEWTVHEINTYIINKYFSLIVAGITTNNVRDEKYNQIND